MRKVKAAQCGHVHRQTVGRAQREQGHLDWDCGNTFENGFGLHPAGSDAELRAAAQSVGEQTRLHAIGVRDQDAQDVRGGGW